MSLKVVKSILLGTERDCEKLEIDFEKYNTVKIKKKKKVSIQEPVKEVK
jgi:hypothetical protein